MPTAIQIADLRNALGKLFPQGKYSNDHVDNLVTILTNNNEETIARSTSVTTFNNDGTLADIGIETASLPINGVYDVEVFIRVASASATPGAEIKFVAPAGASFAWDLIRPAETAAAAEFGIGDTGSFATVAGTVIVVAKGLLTVGATAGTLKVQGAQGTPTVENTDYAINSYMVLTRIA